MRFCFVGHSFHHRTRSHAFFLEMLRELGDVDEFHSSPDESPLCDDELLADLANSDYDCYVFWQTEYIAERLSSLRLGRFIIVPMFDGAEHRPAAFWHRLLDADFISFSRTLHERLRSLDCRSYHFQYFPPLMPDVPARDGGERHAFFWERRPDQRLNLPFVLGICEKLGITRLQVHQARDFADRHQSRRQLPVAGREGVELVVSSWFEDAADFRREAQRPLFFFAPRETEGIGMALVEAMAAGQIVIAPDRPTANEYLSDLVNGILYDLDNPVLPDQLGDADLAAISAAALRRARSLRAGWIDDLPRLRSIVARDGRRWATSDRSAGFVTMLQERARDRVWNEAEQRS